MERVIGAPARPQALFVGFEEDDPALQAMVRLVARAQLLTTSVDDWKQTVRLEEWDIVVSAEPGEYLEWVPPWMFVLAMNGSTTPYLARALQTGSPAPGASYSYSGSQPSAMLHANVGDLPAALQRLVTSELIPWLNGQPARPYLMRFAVKGSPSPFSYGGQPVGQVFVYDADRHIIAGHFAHVSESSYAPATGRSLIVPHLPSTPALWLSAAIDIWRGLAPAQFADLPTWSCTAEYQSSDERSATAALSALEAEHAHAVSEYAERRNQLEAALVQAKAETDVGRRRLLTEQGDVLVEAVHVALEDLGFVVADSDAMVPPDKPRMEDLKVIDPERDEWTNLTEVKGYTGGGKTSDLLKLGRYAAAYFVQHQSWPASRWYVVNQFIEEPPDRRPILFAGADEDLAAFAQDGGLAIDTRDIFALVRRVEDGGITSDEARASLRSQTGRYTLPDLI